MADQASILQSNSSFSLTNLASLSKRGQRKWRHYFKLIDLYKKNECLWMENHKDFCNFALKEEIWEKIAMQMTNRAHPNPVPEKWKHLVVRWRYKVQLEQLHKEQARFYNKIDMLPPKLRYSDQFQFLLKHMFDRNKSAKKVVQLSAIETDAGAAAVSKVSLSAKYMRLGRSKNKNRTSFGNKLQSLESLRNRRHSMLSLTPEAFQKLH